MGSSKGDAPEAPDYAAANREAILTDIETLPERYAARAEWEPLLQQLMLQGQADSADYTADAILDVQERYSPGFIAARQRELEMSDPEGQAARDALYKQVMYDLTGQVPDDVSYDVSYPEGAGGEPSFDVEARINAILGERPADGETVSLNGEQVEAALADVYSERRSGRPTRGNDGFYLERQRSDILSDLGVDGDLELSAADWDERAERLRSQLSSISMPERGMPEVTEIRTPGELNQNSALTVNEGYESSQIAQALYDELFADLGLGAELSDDVRSEVAQSVRGGQAARGNILGNSAIYEEAMQTGLAGEARKLQRRNSALGFLSSGTTPEDIAYRQKQQALANVGSFMAGTTPVAQFSQLQGAQQGAAPYVAQNAPQVLDPNAGAMGTQFAMQSYGQQSQNWANQSNPWMAGLGLGISALGIPTGGSSTVATSLFG